MYDLGIVLAHEFDKENSFELSNESAARVQRGVELFQGKIFKKLVMSGGMIQGSEIPIADKMEEYARSIYQNDFSGKIIKEPISLDTVGQMVFLKEGLINPRRIKKILFITHHWHSAKATAMINYFFGKEFEINVEAIERGRYAERRIEDTFKIKKFKETCNKKIPGEPLIGWLTREHPWYRGKYPYGPFNKEYFVIQLEKLKKKNEKD